MQNNVRATTKEDIDEIHKIDREFFSTCYSKVQLEEMIEDSSYIHMVFEENGILGYLGVKEIIGEYDLCHIAVRKEFWGKNIGSKLLEELKNHAKKNRIKRIHLEVRESNLSAIKLYEKQGFFKVGLRKDYYQNPKENAKLMMLEV